MPFVSHLKTGRKWLHAILELCILYICQRLFKYNFVRVREPYYLICLIISIELSLAPVLTVLSFNGRRFGECELWKRFA